MAQPPITAKRPPPMDFNEYVEQALERGLDENGVGLQAYVHLRGGDGFDEIIPQKALNYINQRATSTFTSDTLVAIGLAHANTKKLRNVSPDYYIMRTIYKWKLPVGDYDDNDNGGLYRPIPTKVQADLMGSEEPLDPRAVRVVMVHPIKKTTKDRWVHLIYDDKVHRQRITRHYTIIRHNL